MAFNAWHCRQKTKSLQVRRHATLLDILQYIKASNYWKQRRPSHADDIVCVEIGTKTIKGENQKKKKRWEEGVTLTEKCKVLVNVCIWVYIHVWYVLLILSNFGLFNFGTAVKIEIVKYAKHIWGLWEINVLANLRVWTTKRNRRARWKG